MCDYRNNMLENLIGLGEEVKAVISACSDRYRCLEAHDLILFRLLVEQCNDK